MVTKTLGLSLLLYFAFTQNGLTQSMDYPKIPNDNKILFIGEGHRIAENHLVQFELIKHYVENEAYNAIILEQSSVFQPIIDNVIKYRDTTNLSLVAPVILCNIENCQHDFKPVIDFFIQITDLAREKNIPIYCFDTEENFFKTKQILLSIVDTAYTVNPRKGYAFEQLKRSESHWDIKDELLELYATKNKWKKNVSKPAYSYIDKIITNVYLQRNENRYMRLRENYLYNQFNTLLKDNKELKPIAVFGLAHTHKHYDMEATELSKPMYQSVTSYLNEDEKSVCKGKVTSIALTYFFNSGEDSTYTYFGYFENEDLKLLKGLLGNQKYFISKTTDIPISPYLQKAFDYVISINDCRKLFEHTNIYLNPKRR
jgi:hypothetical protein